MRIRVNKSIAGLHPHDTSKTFRFGKGQEVEADADVAAMLLKAGLAESLEEPKAPAHKREKRTKGD